MIRWLHDNCKYVVQVAKMVCMQPIGVKMLVRWLHDKYQYVVQVAKMSLAHIGLIA